MTPAEALVKAGITYDKLGSLIRGKNGQASSRTACHLAIRCATYPQRFGESNFKAEVERVVRERGVRDEIDWHEHVKLGPHGEHGPLLGEKWEKRANRVSLQDIREMELMQLNEEVLALFRLKRNPFENDLRSESDVFKLNDGGYEKVEREILRGIKEHSMLALVAPSGSGKTTLWEGIEDDLINREDVVLCKPMAADRERLRPTHMVRALLFGLLGDSAQVAGDIERMSRQLYSALKDAQAKRRTVILYIDDAHFMNRTLLRQIKRFYEFKTGRDRMLSIVMIGIEALGEKLGQFREVGDRTRTLTMPVVPVEKYLEFKLGRVGSSVPKLFDSDGLKAFKERFQAGKGKHAVGRPLAINAACIRCMVALEENGAVAGARINRDIVDGVESGQPRARRAA